MPSAEWEVARPSRSSRVAGVGMAGFSHRGTGPVDGRAISHPAVTLILEFGDGTLVVDNGRPQRGSLVGGLPPKRAASLVRFDRAARTGGLDRR